MAPMIRVILRKRKSYCHHPPVWDVTERVLQEATNKGSYSNPENLLKELFSDQDKVGGYNSASPSSVIDSFGGNDTVNIDDGVHMLWWRG